VALSTTEVEYMAAIHASMEEVWLHIFCSSMGLVHWTIKINYDSQSATFLVKNHAYHSKKKHLDVHYHFVRDMVEDKKVLFVNVDTLKNTSDALTKSVSTKNFSWCTEKMGITGLDQWLSSPVPPMERKQVGECWVCVIFLPWLPQAQGGDNICRNSHCRLNWLCNVLKQNT